MDKRWRLRWQVVSVWSNGAVLAVCSHQTFRRAEWCAFGRCLLASMAGVSPGRTYEVRRRPDTSTTI